MLPDAGEETIDALPGKGLHLRYQHFRRTDRRRTLPQAGLPSPIGPTSASFASAPLTLSLQSPDAAHHRCARYRHTTRTFAFVNMVVANSPFLNLENARLFANSQVQEGKHVRSGQRVADGQRQGSRAGADPAPEDRAEYEPGGWVRGRLLDHRRSDQYRSRHDRSRDRRRGPPLQGERGIESPQPGEGRGPAAEAR